MHLGWSAGSPYPSAGDVGKPGGGSRRAKRPNLIHSNFAMNARLSVHGPLDVAQTLARYRLWGEDPANRLEDGRFRRAVRVDRRWHGYDLTWTEGAAGPQLQVSVPGSRSMRVVDVAVADAGHVLGLDLDLASYNRGRELSERAIRRRAAAWGEHQNMAVHYLLAGQRLAAPATGGGA